MRTIDHQDRGGFLAPLENLQFFARKPVTVPLEPRPASENYRGFHRNDWDLCIGCSTCQKVCDNAAIYMVRIPGLPEDPVKGVRNLRPAIDYGRCCWCALCVDLCPTGSISLSREYVHTCTDAALDSYFILPDEHGIHGIPFPDGWAKSRDADMLARERVPMTEMSPQARSDNFEEIVAGYTDEQAMIEASRCVQCGMCHDACPTQMHAPEYIRAIWKGDPEQAVREIYRTNPFAHTCGRVCTHRCEDACAIGHGGGHRGAPIAIRWLKRYAMDKVPHERVKEIIGEQRPRFLTGKKVAVVGAGPAGLTAAFDLAKLGHRVTVYEAQPQAGGMTRYGIPYYRLPAEMLDRDIDVIRSSGVEIQYETPIGKDPSLQQLRQDNDAVLIAVGLWLGRSTRIPGSDHKDVHTAVALLRDQAAGIEIPVPRSAVVIGGGNVAMDIARTLSRLQINYYGEVRITLTALEDLDHFLADPDEIDESRAEGIEILDARGPREILIEGNKIVGLKTWRVLAIFDEQGRFAPKLDDTDEQTHPAEMVIEAIGQTADIAMLGEELTETLEWNRGRLQVDDNGRTSVAWLWAAGDMVRGPDVISAVADGHRVATSIDQFITLEEQTA